jgi:kumamolisin
MSAAFQVKLDRYALDGKAYRSRTREVMLPGDLVPIVTGIFGLDDRTQARAHIHRPYSGQRAGTAPSGTFSPPQVSALYNFPTLGNGAGQTIGIIELNDTDGGGYRQTDVKHFFKS